MRILVTWVHRLLLGGALLCIGVSAAQSKLLHTVILPTGQLLTPSAAPGAHFMGLNPGLRDAPNFVVGQTVSEALSPDRNTLLVLTSGYNEQRGAGGARIAADSNEYVFVFDVSRGSAVQKQVLQIPKTYIGIAFSPIGDRFIVSGGGDDCLHVFELNQSLWRESGNSPIKLRHAAGIGIGQSPMAQGVAVSADGKLAVVTNRYNASITIVSLESAAVVAAVVNEIDLRPGKSDIAKSGTPGGEYPNAVAIVGNQTAFISSERDREMVVVDLMAGAVSDRIALSGNPNKMILNKDQSLLYVAVDNADVVTVIDTRSRAIVGNIPSIAPEGMLHLNKNYRGASPNGLALAASEQILYVTNRGTNSVAVIDVGGRAGEKGRVLGLIPTGWYPADVAVGAKDMLYVVNTQSVSGPNTGGCLGAQVGPCEVKSTPATFSPNSYILNLEKGGMLSLPLPDQVTLDKLTKRVASNNQFSDVNKKSELMENLRRKIKHVIYIIKENRTYDQVLGDIGRGNSDPRLAEFPQSTTPNLHKLANQFVLMDNFFDSGNVSGNGWPWSTAARESDAGAKMLPVNYAQRGGSYDWEGTNSNVNVGLTGESRLAANPLSAAPLSANSGTGKLDPDVLPGTGDVAAPDGPDGERQQGYLWDAALRAGLSLRNYGFMIDLTRYSTRLLGSPMVSAYIPLETDPFSKGMTVAYAANPELVSVTDRFYRGFDTAFPDTYREREWAREFQSFVSNGNLPALSLVRFMEDHTGSYKYAIAGVNTPEIQVADNDYAVGKLVEAVAHSPYAQNTLIFIVEDDAQDGPDHVDAHRSTAFVVGPYVKRGAIVSSHLTTVNLLRTITDVLGLDHLSVFDATQQPMSELFDLSQEHWTYAADTSALLTAPGVSLGLADNKNIVGAVRRPTHTAQYWTKHTQNMDFDEEDKVDAAAYNRVMWKGLMGKRPYPSVRSGPSIRSGARLNLDD